MQYLLRFSVAALRKHAREHKINLHGATLKKDIASHIDKHESAKVLKDQSKQLFKDESETTKKQKQKTKKQKSGTDPLEKSSGKASEQVSKP